MSSLSPDGIALSLLLALLLPNDASAEALNDTTEPDNMSTQDQTPSSVAEVQEQALKPRRPVETPPTEYLPYPPPDNYQWPPGENAGNENPQPSEFNPPAGWYTGQSGSGSSGSQTQTSAASASLRPPTIFRLLASSLGTNARRTARPQVYPSQLDSQHPTFGPHPPIRWPPGAIPSVETPPTTPVLLPPSWPLLSRLLVSALPAPARSAVIPRKPVETPPTEYLPYLPPPNYDWPAGENPGNEYPQPSEFNPPAGWYGGTGSGGSSSAPGTVSPASNGAVLAYDSGHSPALSAGAIAGISVGGSVLLALVTWFIWRRRKINKRKKAEGGGELPMSEAD